MVVAMTAVTATASRGLCISLLPSRAPCFSLALQEIACVCSGRYRSVLLAFCFVSLGPLFPCSWGELLQQYSACVMYKACRCYLSASVVLTASPSNKRGSNVKYVHCHLVSRRFDHGKLRSTCATDQQQRYHFVLDAILTSRERVASEVMYVNYRVLGVASRPQVHTKRVGAIQKRQSCCTEGKAFGAWHVVLCAFCRGVTPSLVVTYWLFVEESSHFVLACLSCDVSCGAFNIVLEVVLSEAVSRARVMCVF
ncbi:unnamed protein product [Ectocarpus sp. 12 AP-2014]